jgi:hypothetical protein
MDSVVGTPYEAEIPPKIYDYTTLGLDLLIYFLLSCAVIACLNIAIRHIDHSGRLED